MQITALLLAQEQLCSVSLVVLATLLLRVRGAISLDQSAQGSAVRVGRIARVLAAICAAGLVVVLLLSTADTTLPTVLVTGVVIVFARYTYAAMATLPHSQSP